MSYIIRVIAIVLLIGNVFTASAVEYVSVRFPLYNSVNDSLVDNAVYNCTPTKAIVDGKETFLRKKVYPYRDTHTWMEPHQHRGYFDVILYSGFEYDIEISALKQGEPVIQKGVYMSMNELDSRFKSISVHVDLRDSGKFEKDEKTGEPTYYMPKMYFQLNSADAE